MHDNLFKVTVKWKKVKVPSIQLDDKMVVVLGKWIRLASVYEEEWQEGQVVRKPEDFIAKLRNQKLKADVFTFFQKPPDVEPKYLYNKDWDNFAAIYIKSYDDWWQKLPQESRKNIRRSVKRGVTIKTTEVNDDLIQGITEIYNETPIRQGKPFPHFGKDFDTVKNEACTLLDRSEFIGAYHENELIGFVKMVYLGKVASILNIISKNAHYDKRPANALIAKAVEICNSKGISYLLYGRYTYGNKSTSPLVEFKKRNGFEEVKVPRYYIPLTVWGCVVVRLKLYRGLLGILPSGMINLLLGLRSWVFQKRQRRLVGSPAIEKPKAGLKTGPCHERQA